MVEQIPQVFSISKRRGYLDMISKTPMTIMPNIKQRITWDNTVKITILSRDRHHYLGKVDN